MFRFALVLGLLAVAAVFSSSATASAEEPPPAAPLLSIAGATPDGSSALRIAGTIQHASSRAVFRLRAENGCAREATLPATSTGSAFSVALTADDLADAFACAIDAESGDAALPTIAIAPDATTSFSNDLRLDSAFAVAAAELDPQAGHIVRFTVIASSGVIGAHVTLDGARYAARIAPSEEGSETPTSAIFDVPARAWASAVVTRSAAHVDVDLEDSTHRAITLRPSTRIELITDEDDEDTQ